MREDERETEAMRLEALEETAVELLGQALSGVLRVSGHESAHTLRLQRALAELVDEAYAAELVSDVRMEWSPVALPAEVTARLLTSTPPCAN